MSASVQVPRRILLTGGRAPATLELARKLREAGVAVSLAESVRGTLTAFSLGVRTHRVPPPRSDLEGFSWGVLDAVRADACDVVIGTCEEIFHLVRARPVLSPHVDVFAPTLDAMGRLHHKGRFTAWAASLGLEVPETRTVTNHAVLREAIRSDGEGLVCKPAFSRFATKVRVGPTDAGWVDGVAVSPEHPWVVQERLTGRQVCSWSVVQDGELRIHGAYGMDWDAGTGAALRWTPEDLPELEEWVRRFAAETGLTGQLAFDWFLTERGPVPIECNPRLTSGIHLFGRVDGRAFLDAWFGEGGGEPLRPDGHTSGLWGAMVIYGTKEVRQRGVQAGSELLGSRDVLWSWTDPLPALLNWPAYLTFLWWALWLGVSPMEASTHDIQWDGE
jgi:hypothetical protein